MRVLFFNYEYPPLGGGAGNATFYIFQEFSKIPELEIDLVTSSIDSCYHLEKIGENIRIHRLPIGKNKNNLHFQSQKDLLAYSRQAYFFSRKLIRQRAKENQKYDIIHSFFSVPCGFLSLLLKWQHKIPYVVSLRGADVPGYSERFSLLYVFLKPLIKLVWKKADAVIANSLGLKELALKTNLKQKIEITPNGIAVDEFKPKNFSAGISSGKFEILCVSRLTKRKGVNYLIEAFGELAGKYPNVFLKIVGDGNEKKDLEKQAESMASKNRIEFTGLITHEKLPEIYTQADVFVLLSLNEGMSNTMLEALASGLPIIATDTGGTKELVGDGRNGFIVKMKDASSIAEKLETLIGNPALRQKMAEESRIRAENMSWQKVAEKYLRLYQRNHL